MHVSFQQPFLNFIKSSLILATGCTHTTTHHTYIDPRYLGSISNIWNTLHAHLLLEGHAIGWHSILKSLQRCCNCIDSHVFLKLFVISFSGHCCSCRGLWWSLFMSCHLCVYLRGVCYSIGWTIMYSPLMSRSNPFTAN